MLRLLWRVRMMLVVATALGWSATPSAAQEPADCELVTIYPGYPEYRGNVPGVVGWGDSACLEVLTDLDPSFSRDREDQANRAAAQRLGVPGDIEDWTSETWMAIEAERGLVPQCYACIFVPGVMLPVEPHLYAREGFISPDDPRLALGLYNQRFVATDFVERNNLASYSIQTLPTDDQLRALAGLVAATPGSYLTASDVFGIEHELLGRHVGTIKRADGSFYYLNTEGLYQQLIALGGYAPVPAEASDDDQVYLIAEGVWAIYGLGLVDQSMAAALLDQINQAAQDWRYAGPSRPSFAEFLRDQGPANWF